MFPALDVGFAVAAVAIRNWQVQNFHAQLESPKQQVEIPEGNKFSKIRSIRGN